MSVEVARLTLGCQVSWVMSVNVAWFGCVRLVGRISDLMSAAAICCGLLVDVCKIGDVCCLPTPAHQPFSSNSLDLSAPEEAYSRNARALSTLKFGYEDVFKIVT